MRKGRKGRPRAAVRGRRTANHTTATFTHNILNCPSPVSGYRLVYRSFCTELRQYLHASSTSEGDTSSAPLRIGTSMHCSTPTAPLSCGVKANVGGSACGTKKLAPYTHPGLARKEKKIKCRRRRHFFMCVARTKGSAGSGKH